MEQSSSASPRNTTSNPLDTHYPIIIEIQQVEKTAQGSFQPQAALKLTDALRTSGLLLALPAEEVKNLLFLLTFLTPNGDCLPTAQQLAQAIHVSVAKAHTRMQRLMQFQWQGEPLVLWLRRESGLHAYTPNPKLIAYEHLALHAPAEQSAHSYKAAGRDAIIAYSRTHYGRPRHEVEQMINRQMGWTPPTPNTTNVPAGGLQEAVLLTPTAPGALTDAALTDVVRPLAAPNQDQGAEPEPESNKGEPSKGEPSEAVERVEVRRHLQNVGVSLEQADYLLNHYDLLRIQRQLHWLPYRKVRKPAGFLVAAIEDNYAAPPTLWRHPVSTDATPLQDLSALISESQVLEVIAPTSPPDDKRPDGH